MAQQNFIVVGTRASMKLAAFLASLALPATRKVPLAELGLTVVEKTRPGQVRWVRAKGWRGWFGWEVKEKYEEKYFVLRDPAGGDHGWFPEAPTFLSVGWQYAVLAGEVWAVASADPLSVDLSTFNKKLGKLPEPLVDGDTVLPDWRSGMASYQPDRHWSSKLLLRSEVAEAMEAWLQANGRGGEVLRCLFGAELAEVRKNEAGDLVAEVTFRGVTQANCKEQFSCTLDEGEGGDENLARLTRTVGELNDFLANHDERLAEDDEHR
jgi:hypothetical protein